MKIPKNINESICPQCFGKVYSFIFGTYFCPECKGIWKDGKFKKTKLKLEEFLAKQLEGGNKQNERKRTRTQKST